jgi:hypothetical protein
MVLTGLVILGTPPVQIQPLAVCLRKPAEWHSIPDDSNKWQQHVCEKLGLAAREATVSAPPARSSKTSVEGAAAKLVSQSRRYMAVYASVV